MSIQTVEHSGEKWLKIEHVDHMRPFFMSIVSNSNHWMFISSNGGLSAGRKNAEFSLFPYYTDDKITEFASFTGNKTIIRLVGTNESEIWEVFNPHSIPTKTIERNLYKNILGNKIRFEETNHELGLRFSYEWNNSQQYGFVKKSRLENLTDKKVEVEILDGLQNLLPHGVNSDLQNRSSNLVDAYKRQELMPASGLAVYALSAFIVDKAEPSESLKANVAWSYGLGDETNYLLSSLQLKNFLSARKVQTELDIKGEKGAFLVNFSLALDANSSHNWGIVANVNQDHADVIALNTMILEQSNLAEMLQKDIDAGSHKLKALVGASDGIQETADDLADARHYSNVLFNIMRGGIFDDQYAVEKADFIKYVKAANKHCFEKHLAMLEGLDVVVDYNDLVKQIEQSGDVDLIRLGTEYLPLKFSRRHGDPSRPWNKFSINTQSELDGSKILDYEGNWRDIFQNWEALALSYPSFLKGMIYKFLNASTVDGYNPYRVTKGGIDWEIIEPDDPWSYIGYWGDHQIIYLLKFLELSKKYHPGLLATLTTNSHFVYANVPYRIKSYNEILKNSKDTIDFDEESDHSIRKLMEDIGADGACLLNRKGEIQHATFMEKILTTMLAKLSNFIPEGGIWMNTQRPEWNDANNALVGNGVSMVTLYYLHRFLQFFDDFLQEVEVNEFALSAELATMFDQIADALMQNKDMLKSRINDQQRKQVTDALGQAGSTYRIGIYEQGMSGEQKSVSIEAIRSMVKSAIAWMQHSIDCNQREDKLFHAYNLVDVQEDGMNILYLDEMLEGQVAVLSSGYLGAEKVVEVLDAMRKSALYRPDQQSYILYPNKNIAGFLQRNNIPAEAVKGSSLLSKLLEAGNRQVIYQDVKGGYHFNGAFHNAKDVEQALNELPDGEWSALVQAEKASVLAIFEKVFNHKAFTGRSGTFFAFEGLGSIYWHMVSKLHLAVTEVVKIAFSANTPSTIMDSLMHHFHEIGKGIGVHKDPSVYGAFPTDPYSHTPAHRGAQQPGMTGQVKEDVLVRFMELGVDVENGTIHFNPSMLSKHHFHQEATSFHFVRRDGKEVSVQLPARSLSFTVCQIPVIYSLGSNKSIEIYHYQEATQRLDGNALDQTTSREIFERKGAIEKIIVHIDEQELWQKYEAT